ncbi:MAG: plasmid recombination protein [Oscillospiraceae bacterium]|nr:plasmid recombination protein [Oscillospiraceae bacterium]
MSKLSVSFTLGKASAVDNIAYIKQDIHEAYDELFGAVLAEYNAKQTRKDRQIHDYFTHISEGGREEAYYEAIIQFGDSETATIGSENGELAKKMLDEYMRSFEARNPRLKALNSVLHCDETSYHLHVNFIPLYTAEKKIGMSKGVSMKSALIEQGFEPKGRYQNQLVMWEDSEHKAMEKILNSYLIERDVKGATHAHKSVPEYKASQDWKEFPKRKKNLSTLEVYHEDLKATRVENSLLKVENEKLISERNSPWKSFYYSDPDKQIFVQLRLDETNIPFRESENGFEAQQCYVDDVRKIERQYKSPPTSYRDKLRNRIDKIAMKSRDFDEVLRKLDELNYVIKRGKYIAVKPPESSQFIRLKSLCEHYTELAIPNGLVNKFRFVSDINVKINSEKNTDSLEAMIDKNILHFTNVFVYGVLPMNKVNKKKTFTWTNCAELDKLAHLNKKINEGVTLSSLRQDFMLLENSIAQKEERISSLKEDLVFNEALYEKAVNWYSERARNQADLAILQKHNLTMDYYGRLKNVIEVRWSLIGDFETTLSAGGENRERFEVGRCEYE